MLNTLRKLFGGSRMAAIEAGTLAPEFSNPALDSKTYSLKEALAEGPLLAAFFKTSCPTCQFTFPFLERFHRHFGRVWGISQDPAGSTREFAREYGITFPLLLEDTDSYPISNSYGLTHVPSLFLIDKTGEVVHSSIGFMKKDLEEMARKLESFTGKKGFVLFHPGEDVPASKAG